MRHFRVTVSCQAVETSLMVCLDKELQRSTIRKICEACVKDNYDVYVAAIRLRHNDTTKWISLEQMVQELIDLKLYKIKWERIPVGMTECHHGQAISIPDGISPVHATTSTQRIVDQEMIDRIRISIASRKAIMKMFNW